ncbi:hypothetical protein JCM1393_07540 [Clostridium carnis]
MSYAVNFRDFPIPANTPAEGQLDVPDIRIREISDIIIHGVIKDCSGNAVACALVKVFVDGKGYAHTYTDTRGQYLFNLPISVAGKTIVIKAVKTNKPANCICATTAE